MVSKTTKVTFSTVAIVLVIGTLIYFRDDVGSLLASADAPAAGSEKNQRPPVPVEVTKVRRGELKVTTESVGRLQAREQVSITSQVTGLIQNIHFTEGQRVRQGQVLATLDDDQEQAELAQALATREEAQRQYQRGLELKGSGLVTPARLDELEAAYKTAAASVEVAQARVQNHEIRAPFSGLIGLRQISPGALLAPGTVIAELSIIDPLELAFGVRSEFLPQLEAGLTIRARAAGLAGQTFHGTLRQIDTDIDPQTGNVAVEAALPNAEGLLKPGLFMTVDLVLETRPNALIVPEEALLLRGQEAYVFRIKDNNQVRRVAVKTGQRQSGEVEIRQGLQAGDTIVVNGLQKIREGQQVNPRELAQDDKSLDNAGTRG